MIYFPNDYNQFELRLKFGHCLFEATHHVPINNNIKEKANIFNKILGTNIIYSSMSLLGLGRISGLAGYPAIFNIRPDTGYYNYPVTGYPADF